MLAVVGSVVGHQMSQVQCSSLLELGRTSPGGRRLPVGDGPGPSETERLRLVRIVICWCVGRSLRRSIGLGDATIAFMGLFPKTILMATMCVHSIAGAAPNVGPDPSPTPMGLATKPGIELDQALSEARASRSPVKRAEALRNVASQLSTEGRIETALEVVREARAVAESHLPEAELEAIQSAELEAHLLQTAGRSRESLKLLESAFKERMRRGEISDAGDDLNLTASALFFLGEYDFAAERAYAALRLAEDAELPAVKARASYLLGMINRQLGRHEEALELFRDAVAAADRADNPTQRQQAINEEANMLSYLGRIDEAIERKRVALDLARELAVPAHLATCEHDMGVLLNIKGDLDGALAAFRTAHETFGRLGMLREASVSAGNLCSILMEFGQLAEAARWADRAVELARRGELPTEEQYGLSMAASVAAEREDFRAAFELISAAFDLDRQAATGETAAAIEDLKAQYEAERRQTELEHERLVRELELKRERLRRRTWFAAFVVTLGFLALIAYLYRLKIRANRTISRANRELETARAKLDALAKTDALTGLANRREFEARLTEETLRSDRSNHRLSLLILDVDHFKRFNDRYGHDVGDLVLKHLAGVLTGSTRTLDLPARWGGEEFAVVLPETDPHGARVVAEAIRTRLRTQPCHVDGHELPVTVTIGLAGYSGGGADELLRRADEALLTGKRAGRDRVVADSELPPASAWPPDRGPE